MAPTLRNYVAQKEQRSPEPRVFQQRGRQKHSETVPDGLDVQDVMLQQNRPRKPLYEMDYEDSESTQNRAAIFQGEYPRSEASNLMTRGFGVQDHDSYPATTSGRPSSASPPPQFEPQTPSIVSRSVTLKRDQWSPSPSQRIIPAAQERVNRFNLPQRASKSRPQHTGAPLHSMNIEAPVQTYHSLQEQSLPKHQSREIAAQSNVVLDEPLDYSIDELYKMDFADLENESFDHNPRSKGTLFRDIDDSLTIADRMTLVRNMSPQQQQQFIASLSAEEWEEAGEWFVSEFARLNARNVENRRKQRSLAQEREAVVSRRFSTVKSEASHLQKLCDQMSQKGHEFLSMATAKQQ